MPFLSALFFACGFKIKAQRAGVKDRATKAEIAMEMAMVKANCL